MLTGTDLINSFIERNYLKIIYANFEYIVFIL